ncbi:MAG: 23S rRNA (uracil(1939)-C(5))-methyltransferase RlmD [Eggerthellaceae bacterium]|nr:23S rRNA (uracil(1939)-C(5))-methyltransferase RlmD [Eggerthellaceae bacterium]
MEAQQIITVKRMGYGSEAVGRLADGKTVFVEGAAPGDVVEVAVVEDKPTFCRARIVRVVEPSDVRVQPFCEMGGVCGGCPWQHVSYDAQLVAKRDNVVAALVRTAHFAADAAEEAVAPCVPSKRQTGYRNKLELGVSRATDGGLALGFLREGSHDPVVPVSCPVATRPIQKAPKALRGALRFLSGSQDLGLFRVGVRGSVRTGEVEIALWTSPGAFPRAAVANTLGSALKATSIVRVVAEPGRARKVKKVEVLAGKGYWAEELSGCAFRTSAPSFFQVNTAQAEKLVDSVLVGLSNGDPARLGGRLVADLYSGGGTFSVPLARAGADTIAVESAGSSVRDLRRNAEANHVDIEVIGGDTARELPELGGLDALVVDPPRAGLADGVVESIAAAAPGRVAYVSCNPATWARDVARFEQNGYQLLKATPVDMFPQTHHIEVASIFRRL